MRAHIQKLVVVLAVFLFASSTYAAEEMQLRSVTDRNGNITEYKADGIYYNGAKIVSFTRNDSGFITSMTAPNGKTRYYEYAGNLLMAATDFEGNTERYEYNADMMLVAIIDKTGKRTLAVDYDTQGRMVGQRDADGNLTQLVHDIAARREEVIDALGIKTVFEYDEEGNILRTIDGLGNVSKSTFDEFGNILSATDELGRRTVHTYNDRDQRTSTTDPFGNTTRFEYNAFGGVTKTTDPLGRVTENIYDNFGNLLQSIDALGQVTTKEYHDNLVNGIPLPGQGNLRKTIDPAGNITEYPRYENGQPLSMRDALGNLTLFTYGGNGTLATEQRERTLSNGATELIVTSTVYDNSSRLIQTTNPDGSITKIEYDENGREKARVDGRGNRTEFFYSDKGLLKTIKFPDLTTQSFSYSATSRKDGITDQLGHVTVIQHDRVGRPNNVIYSTSPFVFSQTIYDSAGQIIQTTDENLNSVTFGYDSASRNTRVTNPLRYSQIISYDSVGNRTRVVDANGLATSFVYDSANRQVIVIYPDNTTAATEYDSLGRTVLIRDQNGNVISSRFDALGRLISRTDDRGNIERFEYDEIGNMTAYIDKTGDRIKFENDKMGRRMKATMPGGQVYRWTYDAAGNHATFIDPRGFTTTYTSNNMNRQTRDDFDPRLPDGNISRTFTATGQPKTITRSVNGITWTIEYEYDNRDRRTRMILPIDAIDYVYDPAGNLLTIKSDKKGLLVTYRYDAANQPKEVEDAQGKITKYTYDPAGNLKTVEYPNGVKQTVTYDQMNRPLLLSWTNSSGEILRQQFILDNVGNRLSSSEVGMSRAWTYDDISRLTSEQVTDPNLQNGGIALGYAYDLDQNRTQRTSSVAGIPGQNFTYNGNDEIIGQSYDANGNVTASASGTTIRYSAINELTDFGGQVTFGYDGLGRRVSKTAGGVTTWSVWDDLNPSKFSQVLIEYEGATPQTATAKRIYTFGHRLISQREEVGGQTSWFVSDAIGSTRLLTDEVGQAVAGFDYDAFGNIIKQSGTRTTNHLFAGEYRDADIGLYYLRARFYDPTTGRMVQRDPIFFDQIGELAAYAYTDNNPVNFIDPTGKMSLSDVGTAIAVQAINISRALPHFGRVFTAISAFATSLLPRLSQGNFQYGLQHIVFRHWHNTLVQGTSRFANTIGVNQLRAIIREASTGRIWRIEGPKRVIEANLGRVIGTDKYGAPTTWVKIVEQAGEVVTAYPIGFP